MLNPLRVLDEGVTGQPFKSSELINMARRNAEGLERTLSQLLELAEIEGGGFHARLTEVDLERLVRTRLAAKRAFLTERRLTVDVQVETDSETGALAVIADLGKLARVFDLSVEWVAPFVDTTSHLVVKVNARGFELSFALIAEKSEDWSERWLEAQVGLQSRVASPGSAFRGVVMSESQFLSRTEEGLGAELWLIHEWVRLHQGQVIERSPRAGRGLAGLVVQLPTPTGMARLKQILAFQVERVIRDLSDFSLVLLRIPESAPQNGLELGAWVRELRSKALGRADLAVAVPSGVALILESCAPSEQAWIMGRVERTLGLAQPLHWAGVHVPTDVMDPAEILALAQRRLRER